MAFFSTIGVCKNCKKAVQINAGKCKICGGEIIGYKQDGCTISSFIFDTKTPNEKEDWVDLVIWRSEHNYKTADIEFIRAEKNKAIEERKKQEELEAKLKEERRKQEELEKNPGCLYFITGARGRNIYVYEDKCTIKTNATIGALLSGNATDGEKTIYYSDCVGVQYKQPGITLGYLQIETPGMTMNNANNNFFNENSFTFEIETSEIKEMAEYVKKRVDDIKSMKNQPIVISNTVSVVEEIKQFKELLDLGIITQEEFDAKKKQLLGL